VFPPTRGIRKTNTQRAQLYTPIEMQDRQIMSLVHEQGAVELMQINADMGTGAIVVLTGSHGPGDRHGLRSISTHAIPIGQGEHCRNRPHQCDVADRQHSSIVRSA
jgi:hypothetical protein